MTAAAASLLSGEAAYGAVFTGLGVAAAAAFIFAGGTSTNSTGDEAEREEPASEAVHQGNEAAGDASTAGRTAPHKRMAPEQERKVQERMNQLPAETRRALEEWVNVSQKDKMALLAMNCLVLVLFLGIFVLAAAYLIGAHGINVFELKTWRKGAATVQQIFHELNGGRSGASTAHSAEL